MVKQVASLWLDADEDLDVFSIFLNHIGAMWPNQKREMVLGIISHAFFPPNSQANMWRGYDQTPLISTGKFYYPIHVSLGVIPNVWFNNLRVLQIQKELNLIQPMHISLDHFTHTGGEITAKIKALEEVVKSEIMNRYRIPPRKKLMIMSTQKRLHIDRAEAMRIRGLATREGGIHKNL